jgi:hypothetical protein
MVIKENNIAILGELTIHGSQTEDSHKVSTVMYRNIEMFWKSPTSFAKNTNGIALIDKDSEKIFLLQSHYCIQGYHLTWVLLTETKFNSCCLSIEHNKGSVPTTPKSV